MVRTLPTYRKSVPGKFLEGSKLQLVHVSLRPAARRRQLPPDLGLEIETPLTWLAWSGVITGIRNDMIRTELLVIWQYGRMVLVLESPVWKYIKVTVCFVYSSRRSPYHPPTYWEGRGL